MKRISGLLSAVVLCCAVDSAWAEHRGHEPRVEGAAEESRAGRAIPGVPFQVFVQQGPAGAVMLPEAQAEAAVRAVVDAVTFMLAHRADYPRFDEALRKDALKQIVIEPRVLNQEGKEFPFLVARTKEPGKVTLLISAAALQDDGLLHEPERLAARLAREFQWVVSKADTAPKAKAATASRDPDHAPIRMDAEIRALSGAERVALLQALFEPYLKTVDDLNSLEGRSSYEVGTSTPMPPTQADSTTKLYDIRVREALQMIVREPSFLERTPKAVLSLLNGKVWNVAFVQVEQRDWATRTRVAPESKAVRVGTTQQTIQPAAILLNLTRTASPDDPFYPETKDLPMGALSPAQLARVIALEIQQNITEKSQPGHVAQDRQSAP